MGLSSTCSQFSVFDTLKCSIRNYETLYSEDPFSIFASLCYKNKIDIKPCFQVQNFNVSFNLDLLTLT